MLKRLLAATSVTLAVLLVAMYMLPTTPNDAFASAESDLVHEVETDPIPEDAIRVCEDCDQNDLQAVIDDAPEGAVIVVEGGEWPPLTINNPIRLVGQDWPIIDAQSKGSGIVIDASDVSVEGFDIRKSGRSFDHEDSGIYFEGERTQILNNRLTEVHFGINGATGHDSVIAGNFIRGHDGIDEGLRGDAIKVWWSHGVIVRNNHVTQSRDLLVWYSNNAEVYENLVTDSRYGFHFMNSDDGTASRNALVDNSVGIYIMYGKRFTVQDNLLQNSRGPSGHGLGLKEVDGVDVIGNVIYDNRIGVYNDNSPFSMNVMGVFRNNMIAYNDIGVGVLPSARANVYYENSFVENLEQVTVLGGGELSEGNSWSQNGVGNYWSEYAGYDSDGDGIGDVPYRNATMSEQLRRSHPELQIFRFSLAETAVDFASQAVPLFETKSVLEDRAPLVRPMVPTNAPAIHEDDSAIKTGAISITLILGVAASMWWATRPSRAADELSEVA